MSRLHRFSRLRSRLYSVLELGPGAGRVSTAVSWILVGLIAVTLTATILESVPRLANAHSASFEII